MYVAMRDAARGFHYSLQQHRQSTKGNVVLLPLKAARPQYYPHGAHRRCTVHLPTIFLYLPLLSSQALFMIALIVFRGTRLPVVEEEVLQTYMRRDKV